MGFQPMPGTVGIYKPPFGAESTGPAGMSIPSHWTRVENPCYGRAATNKNSAGRLIASSGAKFPAQLAVYPVKRLFQCADGIGGLKRAHAICSAQAQGPCGEGGRGGGEDRQLRDVPECCKHPVWHHQLPRVGPAGPGVPMRPAAPQPPGPKLHGPVTPFASTVALPPLWMISKTIRTKTRNPPLNVNTWDFQRISGPQGAVIGRERARIE